LKNGEKSMTHEEAKKRRAKISDLMRGNGPDGKCLTKAQARAVVDGLPTPKPPKPRLTINPIAIAALLAAFATMRAWYVLPAFVLACAVWYADYMRHDLPSLPTYQSDDPKLLAQIEELGR
jgi:hypothetical protein